MSEPRGRTKERTEGSIPRERSRSRDEPSGKSSGMPSGKKIVIYLAAHGAALPDEFINSDLTKDVKILDFSGDIGTLGEMVKGNNIPPVDFFTLTYLSILYHRSNPSDFDYFDETFSDIQDLKDLYDSLYDIRYPLNGFQIKNLGEENRVVERLYQFKPSAGEDCKIGCRGCKRGDVDCSGFERNPNKKYCPFYGITVIAASDDNSFTMSAIKEDKIEESIPALNLNSNTRCGEYWKQKAIRNAVNNTALNGAIESIFEDNKPKLSEILLFFKSMGYNEIYIYDPSCKFIMEEVASEPLYSQSQNPDNPSTYSQDRAANAYNLREYISRQNEDLSFSEFVEKYKEILNEYRHLQKLGQLPLNQGKPVDIIEYFNIWIQKEDQALRPELGGGNNKTKTKKSKTKKTKRRKFKKSKTKKSKTKTKRKH